MQPREDPHNGLLGLIVWKCLNYLPGRERKHAKPSDDQRPEIANPRPANDQRHRISIPPSTCPTQPTTNSLRLVRQSQETGGKAAQAPMQQLGSPFFKLPVEIRQIIYSQLLGDNVFHIVRRHAKLGHKVCKTDGDPEECIVTRCRGIKLPSGVHAGYGDGSLMQILQSCQRIYFEAIEVLYSRNIFDFDSIETFMAFSTLVRPQRLDLIRRLQFDFRFNWSMCFAECTPKTNAVKWNDMWRLIAAMESLKGIQMRCVWQKFPGNEIDEFVILEPLRCVTGPSSFEVMTPELRTRSVWEQADVPFRLVPHSLRGSSLRTKYREGCSSLAHRYSNDI